jgi:hypothetical protein
MDNSQINAFRELTTVRDQVAWVLENVPQARDSDKVLIYEVLSKYYNVRTLSDTIRPDVPSMESIRRARQRLQCIGFCPGIKRTDLARTRMEEVYRAFAE